MAVYNSGLPSTNLTADDIYDTLAANGGSVSKTDTQSFFKSGAKINIWSKWKPTHIKADFIDSESTFASYNFGIQIPVVYTLQEAFAGSSMWTALLPQGGSNSPYRMGDFRNYRADATSPFREIELDRNTAIAGDTLTATLYCRMFNTSNENGMIGLNDMATLSNSQVVFIKKSPSNSYSSVTSSGTIASNHGSISATFPAFSTSSSERGTHTIMAALVKNSAYYPLPIAPKTMVVEESKLYDNATLSATCYSDTCSASLTYLRGTTNSNSITLSPTFYFGDSSSQWIMITGSTVKIEPGKYGTSTCLIDKYQYNSSYWSQIYSLAQNDNLYVRCSAGGGTKKVNVIL